LLPLKDLAEMMGDPLFDLKPLSPATKLSQ